jgi:protein SCO1/2
VKSSSRARSRLWACVGLVALACNVAPRGRRFAITGQVVAIHAERDEVLLRHDDIPGFMPAMVMPFTLRDKGPLARLQPGDLVKGLLVVGETTASLETLEKTGFRALAPDPAPASGAALAPGEPVPDVRLVDSEGKERRLSEWRGRALAVTFIFTRCPLPEFCPAMDRRFAELQEIVRSEPALRDSAHLVSVSFDPAFDTPEVLAEHAHRLGADPGLWTFASGTAGDVEAFGRGFGLSLVREGGITHNLRTAVVDASGRLVKVYRGAEWAPGEVARELRAAGPRG